ncbi:MAG: hypothetical protein ABR974_01080 [Bacteroidales bacterium]|jgi:hypothetical protein
MDKKRLPPIEIHELFLVRGDLKRTYVGEIFREKAEDGKEIIDGNVKVNEGKIWCIAETQDELGTYLDDMCLMKLDMGLHSNAGEKIKILDNYFYLN